MSRQDRQGARTPADLERKYGSQIDRTEKKVNAVGKDMLTAFTDVNKKIADLDNNLYSARLFDRLTDNGKIQGFYTDGEKYYVNAEVIRGGTMQADVLATGKFEISNEAWDMTQSENGVSFSSAACTKGELEDGTIVDGLPRSQFAVNSGCIHAYTVSEDGNISRGFWVDNHDDDYETYKTLAMTKMYYGDSYVSLSPVGVEIRSASDVLITSVGDVVINGTNILEEIQAIKDKLGL